MSREYIYINTPPTIAKDFIIGLLSIGVRGAVRISVERDYVLLQGKNAPLIVEEALRGTAQHIERYKEIVGRAYIPQSGNDRNIITSVLKSLNISPTLDPAEIARQAATALLKQKTDKSFKLPSLLKPEAYEFNRIPGYRGEGRRKYDEEYPASTILLGVLGYLACRVGRVRVGTERGDVDSVIVVPDDTSITDPNYLLKRFLLPFRALSYKLKAMSFWVPGLAPETALMLWLAINMPGGPRAKIITMREPSGQNPAVITSLRAVDLNTIYYRMQEIRLLDYGELLNDISRILADALSPNRTSKLIVDFANLLYESLMNIKSWNELLYRITRDAQHVIISGGTLNRELMTMDRIARRIFMLIKDRIGG